MPDTVPVTLEVDVAAAAALADARTRAAMGRLVSRVLHPSPGPSDLAQAIADAKREARSSGLTDADIDAELAAYNAERQSASTSEVVARFQAFAAGHTLDGLAIKDLISEGRR